MLEQFFDVRLDAGQADLRLQPGRIDGRLRRRRVQGARRAANSAVGGRRLRGVGRRRDDGRAVFARAAVERRRSQAAVRDDQLRGPGRDRHLVDPGAQHRAACWARIGHDRPIFETDARRVSGPRLSAQESRPLAAGPHAAGLAAEHSQSGRRAACTPCPADSPSRTRRCFRW